MEAFLVSKTPWLVQTSRHSSTLLSVCISHRWAALNHSTGLSPEKGEGGRVWTGFISRLFLDPCQIPAQQPFISAYIQESCWAPLYLGVCTAGTSGRSRDLYCPCALAGNCRRLFPLKLLVVSQLLLPPSSSFPFRRHRTISDPKWAQWTPPIFSFRHTWVWQRNAVFEFSLLAVLHPQYHSYETDESLGWQRCEIKAASWLLDEEMKSAQGSLEAKHVLYFEEKEGTIGHLW